ncbi:MAG: hypothetical protein ACTHVE_09860 [Senegalia sp. (in: firmicutes)]|uniref:hypothetical protein n=1 Tax=Senegalia sp. (in: firmicutes) TaxID=1924098 RepID=UPI003F986312
MSFLKEIIIIVSALSLQKITYKLGGFNFEDAPLFSLKTFYDLSIFVVYFIVIAFILGKL